jgi:hypothetical protein
MSGPAGTFAPPPSHLLPSASLRGDPVTAAMGPVLLLEAVDLGDGAAFRVGGGAADGEQHDDSDVVPLAERSSDEISLFYAM